MKKDDKKPKQPAAKKTTSRQTSSKKPAAKKTTSRRTSSKKPAAKKTTSRRTSSKKPAAKKATLRQTSKPAGDLEPDYPADFIRDLEAAEKCAARENAKRQRIKKQLEAKNTGTQRRIEIPKGARVRDIRIHYKID